MARVRGLKPGFFLNEYLGTCDPLEALFFQGLWLLADREGRLEYRPMKLKAQVFPYREMDIRVISGFVRNLSRNGFLHVYQVGKTIFLEIENFSRHQNPHKNEKPSEIPDRSQGIDIAEVCKNSSNYPTSTEEVGNARAVLCSLFSVNCSLSSDNPLTGGCDEKIPSPPVEVEPPAPKPAVAASSEKPQEVDLQLEPTTEAEQPKQGQLVPIASSSPGKSKAKEGDTPLQALCRSTWKAYSLAYFERYGTEPVRNGKVNSQIKAIAQRLGAEAPHVVSFFVQSNNAYYARQSHAIGAMLNDAEGLRTQWATGARMNSTIARQGEQRETALSVADQAKKIMGLSHA